MSNYLDEPVVVGQRPTTLRELRHHARGVLDQPDADALISAAADPLLAAHARKGLAIAVLYLLDEVERLSA